ncbi:MAG: enoyl-CoA hydratase-related protein [Pseudomonadota bacterium]
MNEGLRIAIDPRGVATLSLDRPQLHNAFDARLIKDLHDAFTRLGEDQGVRVVVVRGEGRSFSAGADLTWMREAAGWTREENEADAAHLSDMLQAFNACPKPTLALVHGAAYGGGVGLVACADIALGLADATFAFSEVRLGLIPATIAPYVLAAIGTRAARRYFLTGERFDARTALAIGLLHEVLETPETLAAAGDKVVKALLAGGPHALADAKALIADVADKPIDLPLRRETARRIAQHRVSAEGQEGLAAFFAKRKPAWAPKDG